MEACNEIGTEVDIHYARVVDRLGSVEAHVATVSGNSQTANKNGRSQKSETIKASNLSQTVLEDKNFSRKAQDSFEEKRHFYSSSAVKEETRQQRKE